MFKKDSSSLIKVEQGFRRTVLPENLYSSVVLEEGSIVDADYKGEWLTGVVIKKMEDESYLVYFDVLPDIFEFERKHLRAHLDSNGSVRTEVKELSKSMFSPGTLVEVRYGIGNGEVSWVPAMIVKEIEESGEKKLIMKFCNKRFRFSDGSETKKTGELHRVRPTPPLLLVENYNLLDCVEMFHGSGWRRGIVIEVLEEKCYMVSLKATKETLPVKHMDIRPFMVWEDGVWHTRSVPLESGNSKDGCGKRKREETENLGLNETRGSPCNGSKVCDKGKNICIDDDDVDDQLLSTELTSYQSPNVVNRFAADVLETPAKGAAASPFAKRSPYWKKWETNELHNRVPQAPHFSPLFDVNVDKREMPAIGMMVTFYALLEEIKTLQLDVSSDELNSLGCSLAKLEKYGFDVSNQQSRISKVLSLQAERAKKADKRKFLEEKIEDNKMIRQNIDEKLAELERKSMELKIQELVAKEEKDVLVKRINAMKSCAKTIDQEIEEIELEFQTTISAVW